VFKQFSSFEERHGEYERARVIYKHAVKLLKLGAIGGLTAEEEADLTAYERSKREELYKAYVTFEKKHGDREGIEDVILTKQRAEYNKRLVDDPRDYNAWFEYAKLEEDYGDAAATRDVYEHAVSNLPPSEDKDHW
jgi:crooked neck